MSLIIRLEAEVEALYRDLATLRKRFAEADDAERQTLETPICHIEMDIEELEGELAAAEEAEARSDYYAGRL